MTRVLLAPLSVIAALAAFPAQAITVDKFDPYAFVNVRLDDNVFRVVDDAEAIAVTGDTKKDDAITTYGFGLTSRLDISRQAIELNANINQTRFDYFNELDHTNGRAKANWLWKVGNLWSGGLSSEYQRELSSFLELDEYVLDIEETRVQAFNASYHFHPSWWLKAALSDRKQEQQQRPDLDRSVTASSMEILYRSSANTRVGVRANSSTVDYLNTQLVGGTPTNNDYDQTGYSGVLYWEATGKSSLNASLGRDKQRYDELTNRDNQNRVWRIDYENKITGKSTLNLSSWQEHASRSELTNSYFTRGMRIDGDWGVTAKITVTGGFTRENISYEGLTREDDTDWLSLSGRYNLTRNFGITLGYIKENRDSTIPSSEYEDTQWSLGINVLLKK